MKAADYFRSSGLEAELDPPDGASGTVGGTGRRQSFFGVQALRGRCDFFGRRPFGLSLSVGIFAAIKLC